jgi:hypothetical protein
MATLDMVKSPRIACVFLLRRYSKSQRNAKDFDMETTILSEPDSSAGAVTWLCSEEGGGPDVGIVVALGDGRLLCSGDLTRRAWEDGGEAVQSLGSDMGTWLTLFDKDGEHVIAKVADAEAMRSLIELIGDAIRKGEA